MSLRVGKRARADRVSRTRALCVAVCIASTSACALQPPEDPLDVLGRSAFFPATATAPAGVLEAQLATVYDPGETLDVNVALTYGVTERTEVGLEFVALADRGREDVRGVGDLSFGITSRLLDEQGARPALAVMAAAKLPVGDEEDEISSGETDVFLGATVGKTTPGAVFALAYELGLLGDPEGAGLIAEHGVELVGARHLHERLALLLALTGGWVPEEGDVTSTARAVLAFSASKRALIEAGVELGLENDSPGSQILLGLTYSY